MAMIIFDLHGFGDCQRPKCYSEPTLWHFNSMFGSFYSATSAYHKKLKVIEIIYSFQPPYLEF